MARLARVLVLFGATLTVATACGRILGIEKAHVDPILSDNDTSEPEDDELDTVEVHDPGEDSGDGTNDDDTGHDASAPSDETGDVAGECVSFDNRRVGRLNSDGTLTPLPSVNTAIQ